MVGGEEHGEDDVDTMYDGEVLVTTAEWSAGFGGAIDADIAAEGGEATAVA